MNRLAATMPLNTQRFLRRVVLRGALAVLAAVVLIPGIVRAQTLAAEPPKEIRGLEVQNHLGTTIPLDLKFTNEKGESVPLSTYFNRPSSGGKGSGGGSKPVVMVMVYYRCPMLCPLVMDKFTQTLGEIDFTVGKDFDAVIVSFDPRDTPADAAEQKQARLASYGREDQGAKQVSDGWNFLTSSAVNARALGDALGFPYRALPESGQFAHGACVFILTPEGKIARYLTGLNYPAKDVRLAILDAGGGKIGNIFDAVTLWCYHYDPNAGGYTVQAMRIMRLGAVIMTVLVAGLLLAMLRFEKLKKRRAIVAAGGASTMDVAPAVPARADAAFTGPLR
jgi:protein SCO1